MNGSSGEAIAYSNHASWEKTVGTLNAKAEPDSSGRLSLGVHGLLIGFSRWLKKKKAVDVREETLVAALLITIVCVCSLPSVLYFALITDSSNTDDTPPPSNCTQPLSAAGSSSTDCSTYSWGVVYPNESSGSCSAGTYSGSVCSHQLLEWQECSTAQVGERIFLSSGEFQPRKQEEAEKDVAQFLHFLQAVGSTNCQKVASLLVCQSSFPLCDCESGCSYLASREECERISIVECEEEWTSARQYGIPLPNCTDLPEEDIGPSGDSELIQTPVMDVPNLTCHKDFFESNFTCLPRCADWKQDPPIVSAAIQIIVITTNVAMFLASIVLVVMFALRRKTILMFPMVMLLYAGIGSVLFALLSLISAVGGSQLYCTSEDLIETKSQPTAYCVFQGVVEVFLMSFITLVCFFHISFLFYDIVFPMKALKTKKYFKWVHLTLFTIAIVAPLIVAVSGLFPGEDQYTLSRFPPIDCDGENANFYTVVLPFNVIATIGLCMFVVIGWIVFKKKGSEKKVFIIFIYYIILVIIVMARNELKLAWSVPAAEAINDYFLCEAPGYVLGKCDRSSFEMYSNPVLECLFHIMLMLLPFVNLIFVTNFANVRKRIEMVCWNKSGSAEVFQTGFSNNVVASSIV